MSLEMYFIHMSLEKMNMYLWSLLNSMWQFLKTKQSADGKSQMRMVSPEPILMVIIYGVKPCLIQSDLYLQICYRSEFSMAKVIVIITPER